MKILSPLASPRDVAPLRRAGADELYAGLLTPSLVERTASSLAVNAREMTSASLMGLDELAETLRRCEDEGLPLWIAFNQPLLDLQHDEVLELMERCAATTVRGLILRDPAMAHAVARRHPELAIDVSCTAVVLNEGAVAFWRSLGARRITLPRGLRWSEIEDLAACDESMEFSFLALGDGCPFVNGFCSPIHGRNGPGSASLVRRIAGIGRGIPFVGAGLDRIKGWIRARARSLRGEFCTGDFRLAWPSRPPVPFRMRHPLGSHDRTCAACRLPRAMGRPNLGPAKVAGRIFPLDERVRRTRFLREAIALSASASTGGDEDLRRELRSLHRRTWGEDCGRRACYYPD